VPRHPAEELTRRLHDVPLVILDEVALLEDLHGVDGEFEVVPEPQGGLGLPHLGAALPVEDVGPGDGAIARLHQSLLDEILDRLDAGDGLRVQARRVRHDGLGHDIGDGDRPQAVLEDLEGGPLDGIADLLLFERDDGAVALSDPAG